MNDSYNEVENEVFAAMETGNFDHARMVFTEFRAAVAGTSRASEADVLRAEVVQAYAVGL